MKCCPTCGHPTITGLVAELNLVWHQKNIIELVQKSGTAGVSTRRMAEFLWAADPNGGPLHADSVIKRTVCDLNKKLKPKGLQVRGKRGCRSNGYRLVSLSA